MQLIGFVLICIGILIMVFARKIVQGKTKVNEEDSRDFKIMASGATVLVRMVAFLVILIGLAFLFLGNALFPVN